MMAGRACTFLQLTTCILASQSSVEDGPSFRGVLIDREAHGRALCLDGSSPCFYMRTPAKRSRKFLIFFEGGGFCTSEQDCKNRSRSYYGTTRNRCLHSEAASKFEGRVIQSDDRGINPLTHDWNHVFVRYCDGGYFAGEREDTSSRHGLYYRGRYITEAVFHTLSQNHGLNAATDVIIGGCSAGAIRTISHIDAMSGMIRDLVDNDEVRIAAIADSGYYLDDTGLYGNWSDFSSKPHADGTRGFTNSKKFATSSTCQNGTAMLNKACLADVRSRSLGPHYCLVGSVAAQFVSTPLFLWQSRFDSDQLLCDRPASSARQVAGGWVLGDAGVENYYAGEMTRYLEDTFLNDMTLPRGAFLDSCRRHCDQDYTAASRSQNRFRVLPQDCMSKRTPLQAFQAWYEHKFEQVYYHQTEPFFSAENAYDKCTAYSCCKPAEGICTRSGAWRRLWI